MASSASTDSVVKAGYWFFGRDFNRPVADIPSELFTHLYAGFAEVNDNDGKVTVLDQYSDQFRTFTDAVRVRSPQVKTLLSIGGEASPISPVVQDAAKRQTFITTSIVLARNFGFDGLDLCWLYPSPDDNADNLELLLKDWRTAVSEDAKNTQLPELLLTAEVFHHPAIPSADNTRSFNYPDISVFLNWINVLAIDFYTPTNSPNWTGPVHGWNTRPIDQKDRCGRVGIEEWIKSGVVTNKLVLALPFYGYEWTLKNPKSFSGFFAPANPAKKDPVAYRDIQEAELRRGIYDSNYIAVYSHEINGEKWIGYDDALCVSGKVSEARTRNLGGYFAWHLAADDINWTLSKTASTAQGNASNNPGGATTTTNTGNTTTTTSTRTSTSTTTSNTSSSTSSVTICSIL